MIVSLTLFAMVSLFSGVSVFAAPLSGTPFGDATALGGGTFRIESDSDAPGFGGVSFGIPAPIKFSDITVLDTTQTAEPGDLCIGGAPRFSIRLDTNGDNIADGSAWAYTEGGLGTCPSPTGDLAEVGGPGDVPGRWDTSQLIPGTQVTTYSAALAALGNARVLGISLVVDASFAHPDGSQRITVTPTVEVNLPQPANANACKNGGWQNLFRADGTPFKNQGDCIQYVNTGK